VVWFISTVTVPILPTASVILVSVVELSAYNKRPVLVVLELALAVSLVLVVVVVEPRTGKADAVEPASVEATLGLVAGTSPL